MVSPVSLVSTLLTAGKVKVRGYNISRLKWESEKEIIPSSQELIKLTEIFDAWRLFLR